MGPSAAAVARVSRDKCSALCTDHAAGSGGAARKRRSGVDPVVGGSGQDKGKPVFYSWKTDNERDVDSELGTCQCVTVLKAVRTSFGSFSGFLL